MYPRLLKIDPHSQTSYFLFGPRGTGKTSWLKLHFQHALFFDLLESETYTELLGRPSRLGERIPEQFNDWIVIDEIQKVPMLLNEVHRLIEHRKLRFILTGSSARTLRRKGVNLLAGRALTCHLYPLTAFEIGNDFNIKQALQFGTLPMVITHQQPEKYLAGYIETYLREEVLQEGLTRNLALFTRFLETASFSQGEVLNYTSIAQDVGSNRHTVVQFFEMLEDLLIAYRILPFTKRAKREIVLSPKFYYFDTGVYRTIRPSGPLDSEEEGDGPALETLFLHHGKLITINNYFELFNGILNPKQLEGLRLLLTPFPQQQFNQTDDRRTLTPSRGVACLDCHANGHTNKATHLVGDMRPQEFRHRITTPSLRGVNIQRLFGSQRALKSVEDFTEFEQRAAYYDGDPVIATKKGVNILERGSQVHFMAEFQDILDFPPAPKLKWDGKLDPKKASAAELRGQDLFFGKAQCSTCHTPPYYTDNTMHNLKIERFFKPELINGLMETGDGPIKTFPLRGIKDSPPYLHDGRLLTLEDTVEYFNLILGLQLNQREKRDLVAFMEAL